MIELTPITRIEKFLDAIVNNTTPPNPITRIEVMLNDIANSNAVTLTPITRIECFLAKISGAVVDIPTPITRIETFLAKIAGEDVETPTPITRKEIWLDEWAGGGSDPLNTFTGAIVRFLANRAKPIVKIEANFTPIQDLNGYDAPWPPGGGKNLFNADTGSNGYIDNSGSVVARTYQFASDYIAVSAGNKYTISAASQMANIGIAYFDSSKAIILPRVDNASRQTLTITPATGVAYVRFWFYKNQSTDLNPTNVKETYKVQFEAGSSATTYAPYSNICPISGHTGCDIFDKAEYDAQATPTVTINFGQTVYGGTMTVNEDGSGQAVAEWAKYVMDGSTNAFNVMSDSGTYKFVSKTNYTVPGYNTSVSNDPPTLYCNMFKAKGVGGLGNAFISDKYFRACIDPSFADVAAFNTYLTEHNLEYVYKLETPITIPLTASQINTLVGENVVWVEGSSGDIQVTAYGSPIS